MLWEKPIPQPRSGKQIEPEEDLRLAYRLAYNQGVLQYQLGNYQTAYDFFRQALLLEPGRREARINLEHSFRKLNVKRGASVCGRFGKC